MTIRKAINKIRIINYPDNSPPVVESVISEFSKVNPSLKHEPVQRLKLDDEAGIFNIAIAHFKQPDPDSIRLKSLSEEAILFRIRENGSGWLYVSHPYYLFSFVSHLLENLIDEEIDPFRRFKIINPAFKWQRISYDFFLTQEGRIQRNLNRESYIRELARLGFTHIEINGLAFPKPLETGPKGEAYPMFYTYCPALDQFVYSDLNMGLYPDGYLSANLEYLKQNAQLAVNYGLTPGLLCFEPRSVPEHFFDKYPMLRGARVDHPFRSFKPRYNMTITHPKVREHYAEMMRKLMKEIPELGYIAIWTNDSGAGFEHTKSLYVGRNGGAYLIREWKDDEEIAQLAGENALRFFRILRDAGRETNPDFRVITRLESFYGEHETVWKGLGDGVDAETASLISIGWDMPYAHPRYPDSQSINAGTVYQNQFDEREKTLIDDLEERKGLSHFYFAAGPNAMFAPLIGIPYPTLTYQRLKTLHDNGVDYLAHSGGTFQPDLVPYNVNHEIVRSFQFDPELNIDEHIEQLSYKWAGHNLHQTLVKAWKLNEDALFAFPNITPLYSTYGFAWYRLWARPFVPDIEAIPQEERNYYEEFMCTTPHNPNNVDLSRDVLFQLTTPEKCKLDVERIDSNLWEPLNEAIQLLDDSKVEAAQQLGENNVIRDQLIRLKALYCWFMTQRNVAAWIAGVYGYMQAEDDSEREAYRDPLRDMIRKEIRNSEELIKLLETNVEFMAMTDQGETPLMYGINLKELLRKRIELMQIHIDDKPFIDHGYIERKASEFI